MSRLLRFLGIGERAEPQNPAVEILDGIAQQLDELEPERAGFFAAFAYLLARVAGADLRVQDEEISSMERALQQTAGISAEEARIALEISRVQMTELGGTHNFLVARAFRERSEPAERLSLLRCLYTVAAADGVITGDEAAEITNIAEEIGLNRTDVTALRSEFKDKLAEFRKLPGENKT